MYIQIYIYIFYSLRNKPWNVYIKELCICCMDHLNVFINFSKRFCEYIRMENLSYKNNFKFLKITLSTIFLYSEIFHKFFVNIYKNGNPSNKIA